MKDIENLQTIQKNALEDPLEFMETLKNGNADLPVSSPVPEVFHCRFLFWKQLFFYQIKLFRYQKLIGPDMEWWIVVWNLLRKNQIPNRKTHQIF